MSTEEAVYSQMFVSAKKTESFCNVAFLLARTAAQSSCEAVTEVEYRLSNCLRLIFGFHSMVNIFL